MASQTEQFNFTNPNRNFFLFFYLGKVFKIWRMDGPQKTQMDPLYNWPQGTRGLLDQAKKNKQKKKQKTITNPVPKLVIK